MSSATPTLSRVIQEAIEARLSGLHTMLPGKVIKVDVASGKCDVQPLIQRQGIDGGPLSLPPITNCPIGFYRAGKAAVYLPLKVGDNVEIRFCERSLDIWLTKGGTVDPADARKHNLSDAVVYPGLYDFGQAPEDADPDKLVIVNDQVKMTLDPEGEAIIVNGVGTIKMTADGKFNLTGATDELFTTLIALVDALMAALTLDPITGPQEFTPATVAAFLALKVKLVGLKA